MNVFEEAVWLTKKQMAELFDKERSVITKHINNIDKEGELIRQINKSLLEIANRPITINNQI